MYTRICRAVFSAIHSIRSPARNARALESLLNPTDSLSASFRVVSRRATTFPYLHLFTSRESWLLRYSKLTDETVARRLRGRGARRRIRYDVVAITRVAAQLQGEERRNRGGVLRGCILNYAKIRGPIFSSLEGSLSRVSRYERAHILDHIVSSHTP